MSLSSYGVSYLLDKNMEKISNYKEKVSQHIETEVKEELGKLESIKNDVKKLEDARKNTKKL